jgi:acetophenone carboxylase
MQDLARGAGRDHAPLFAPLLFGVAAQIEAIAPEAMAEDATRLRKNVGELQRMLGTEAVFCSAPGEAEAMVLSQPGQEISPGMLLAHPRIAASLEAAKRWQADSGEPVIVAALTGPATLAARLRERGVAADDETLFEHVGRGLAGLARLFCEAGVHVLQWHEAAPPGEAQSGHWVGALSTAGNVARFHRVPPVLVVQGAAPPSWPPQAIACPSHGQHGAALPRPHGRAWGSDPDTWPLLPDDTTAERLVTTVEEVPADADLQRLMAQTRRVRDR